ncbi:MAG: hypothetical protein ACM4D3_05815 [Candidatus Sericytochromatia bacterium]
MRSRHVYEEEVRDEFERVLNELALNGKPVPAEHPFDWRVLGALRAIAAAHPNATDELICDARRFLDRQMHRWPAHRKRVAG